jgi:glycosyltransferase involved in cell wall biosynthesis
VEKKRIVIDATPLLYSNHTGIGRTTYKLIESLLSIQSDYEITLFGRRMEGAQLSALGLRGGTVHLRLPRSFEWVIQKTKLIEMLCGGDLYHATDFYMPLAKVGQAVATVHDLIFLIQPEKMVDHSRLARWVPKFVQRCRHVIAVSEFTKKDIVERLGIEPEKIDVIYWGVDRNVFHPSQDTGELRKQLFSILGFERPYFLAVSCSSGRKNTPLLLNTYEKFLRQGSKNDLVLVWNPPEEIREKYSSSRSERRIHFINRQTDEDLRLLYCGATALIFPSLYEGFGLPILEAMACGTHVVTSNVTSMPEIAGDAAVYVDPYDENSLLRAMELLENNDSQIQQLSEKTIQQAAKFSWETCALKTLSVYNSCLES